MLLLGTRWFQKGRKSWTQILIPAISFVTLGKSWNFPLKCNDSICLTGLMGGLNVSWFLWENRNSVTTQLTSALYSWDHQT